MRILKKILMVAALMLAVTSCKTPKNITYLQGLDNGDVVNVIPGSDITAQPGDKLSIYVHSRDAALSAQFNRVSVNTQSIANGGGISGGGQNYTNQSRNNPYFVDSFGDIDFPVLGTLHIAGMNRHEIARMIEKDIKDRNLIKDPHVTVEFLDHTITFLGAVGSPGRHEFDRDRLNLLEGIAMAGDLPMTGKRVNVRVIRMIDGKEHAYEVDLTNPESVYSSPVFYLQPNDLVYVEPNDMTKRNTTPMGSQAFTPAFWMSMFSFVSSVVLLVVRW